MSEGIERHEADVLVVGAGGAGLRAAIAASEAGAKVTVLTKSLLGKAHTVMAEGGMAAALADMSGQDSWEAHFADTMKGGKLLNNWRMAEIHAREAPARVLELERWGAVFDRTNAGLIHQRPFGAHTYPRLAHIGDRTGLELIRSLQDVVIHRANVEVLMETTVTELLTSGGRVIGALAYRRSDGQFLFVKARAVLLATGGAGRMYRVTSNSWECTGDGVSLAYEAGATLQDCEMVQFHPTGMVWPPGVRGILVTEGVRGEGGVLRNSKGERFMERYDKERMELSSRDIVSRAINAEVQAGRGSPHGGALLDISHKPADFIRRKLPSMHEQFLKLAKVDITKEPMEVAPTIHYQMGGIKVEPATGATGVPGLYAAGEVASGLHGANRLGGNSLSDLLVFGRRAGDAAAQWASSNEVPDPSATQLEEATEHALRPLSAAGDSPFELASELQEICARHAPIIRDGPTLEEGLRKVIELRARAAACGTGGSSSRSFNPGWHTALDLQHMVANAEALFRSAIERKESRGAHARSDFPNTEPELANVSFGVVKDGEAMKVVRLEHEPIPQELREVINRSYQKYAPEEVE